VKLEVETAKYPQALLTLVTAKRARTIFSPLATHLEVRLEADMAKYSQALLLTLATAKRARTIFSPSPTHLEVRLEAEMAKKVELL
jgi:hypothetical protein